GQSRGCGAGSWPATLFGRSGASAAIHIYRPGPLEAGRHSAAIEQPFAQDLSCIGARGSLEIHRTDDNAASAGCDEPAGTWLAHWSPPLPDRAASMRSTTCIAS